MLTLAKRGRVALAGMVLLAAPALDLAIGPGKPEVMHLVATLTGLLLLAVSGKN